MYRFRGVAEEHSCASILYEMGYDLKDIKEWLGHSDIKMTGNLYAHFNMRQKQGIAASFSANFSSVLEKTLEVPAEQTDHAQHEVHCREAR